MLIQVGKGFRAVKATAANRGLLKLQLRGTWRKGRSPMGLSACEKRAADRKRQWENDWSFLDDLEHHGKAPRQCATGSNLPDPCGCTRTAADHRNWG